MLFLQTMKKREVNPHAKEAWKVTKSSLKGERTGGQGGERRHWCIGFKITDIHCAIVCSNIYTSLLPPPPPLSTLSHTGAAAVFVDLEKGAITVIESFSNETAKTVEHKYILPPSPLHLVLPFLLKDARFILVCCSLQVWGESRQSNR